MSKKSASQNRIDNVGRDDDDVRDSFRSKKRGRSVERFFCWRQRRHRRLDETRRPSRSDEQNDDDEDDHHSPEGKKRTKRGARR